MKQDYKKWFEAIYGEPVLPWSDSKSIRMARLFERLEKKGVIKRDKIGKKIILLELEDKNCFFVPREFWALGWIKKLSGRGLYFYFINLAEFKESPYKPVWINSQKNICWKYRMGQASLTAALKELMAYNVIEVRHDIPDINQPFNMRKANRYFINPLWSEEELGLKWKMGVTLHLWDTTERLCPLITISF